MKPLLGTHSQWLAQGTNTVQGNYFDLGHCLFKFVDGGYCNSSLFNAPSYMDLGGALAAFGLIFTVYQLRDPKGDTILRIRSFWQRYIFWWFGIAGLIVMLLRVLMTQIPINYLIYPFNIPLAYEILAYVLFVLSPLSLWLFTTRARKLFNKRTAKRFYEVLVTEVSQSDDKLTNAALEVLLYNFRDICKIIKKEDRNSEVSKYARSVIDVVLSESSVVKILTTKRLDALQYILVVVEENNIGRQDFNAAIPALIRNLFLDENSFFYKHMNKDGLALSSNIYETVFDSPKLLSKFSLFGYPTLGYSMRRDDRLGNRVFMEALAKAISPYIKTGEGSVKHINEGFEYLSRTFENTASKLAMEKARGVDTQHAMEEEWWTLHDIAHFLSHTYHFLDYQETLNSEVKKKEKDVREANFNSTNTINAAVAAIFYKEIEGMSYVDENDSMYWMTLQEIMDGIKSEEEYKTGYRKPFLKRLWEQIAKNVINKYYPAATKPYLALIGYYLPNVDQPAGGWLGKEVERVRRLLYIDLKPLLDANTKMANDEPMKKALLPNFMNYKDGKFTYRYGFGKGEEKEIPLPPDGSVSALEGVDLENRNPL